MTHGFKNYSIPVAGRIWEFEDIHSYEDAETIKDINFSIANTICIEEKVLTPEELEFLCDLTRTKKKTVAEKVFAVPSTISRWKERGKIPVLASMALKEFFLGKLTSIEVRKNLPPIGMM